MNQGNNRFRGLSDLVSLDAWHGEITADNTKADLYLRLSLNKASFGGKGDDPISFDVSIKNADVIVLLPDDGAFKVPPNSVCSQPINEILVEQSDGATQSSNDSSGLEVGVAKLNINTGATFTDTTETSTTTTTKLKPVSKSWKKIQGNHAWRISPINNNGFDEHEVWRGEADDPLLTLKDARTDERILSDTNTNIQPVVNIQIVCTREQLVISNLSPTKSTFIDKISKNSKYQQDVRMAAAESYLKDLLIEQGFNQLDMTNKNVSIVLADCPAEQV